MIIDLKIGDLILGPQVENNTWRLSWIVLENIQWNTDWNRKGLKSIKCLILETMETVAIFAVWENDIVVPLPP